MVKKREVPQKNYYILFGLLLGTMLIVLYLGRWYEVGRYYNSNNSIIKSVIAEVKPEEIKSYLNDNSNVVLYFSSTDDTKIRKFERQFKNYILKEELGDQIIYIDTANIENADFYNQIVNNYFSQNLKNKGIDLRYIPNLVIVKDGKIKDVMITYNTDININMVETFLLKNGVLEK